MTGRRGRNQHGEREGAGDGRARHVLWVSARARDCQARGRSRRLPPRGFPPSDSWLRAGLGAAPEGGVGLAGADPLPAILILNLSGVREAGAIAWITVSLPAAGRRHLRGGAHELRGAAIVGAGWPPTRRLACCAACELSSSSRPPSCSPRAATASPRAGSPAATSTARTTPSTASPHSTTPAAGLPTPARPYLQAAPKAAPASAIRRCAARRTRPARFPSSGPALEIARGQSKPLALAVPKSFVF